MVLASILFSLFIFAMLIVVYQYSISKNSLKIKTVSQLCQMRHAEFIKYKQAKEMKLYGAMGLRAQIICNIDQELSKKHSSHQKPKSILLEDTV